MAYFNRVLEFKEFFSHSVVHSKYFHRKQLYDFTSCTWLHHPYFMSSLQGQVVNRESTGTGHHANYFKLAITAMLSMQINSRKGAKESTSVHMFCFSFNLGLANQNSEKNQC